MWLHHYWKSTQDAIFTMSMRRVFKKLTLKQKRTGEKCSGSKLSKVSIKVLVGSKLNWADKLKALSSASQGILSALKMLEICLVIMKVRPKHGWQAVYLLSGSGSVMNEWKRRLREYSVLPITRISPACITSN